MISYDAQRYGVFFVLRLRGSVFPKALMWAVPNAALVFLLKYLFADAKPPEGNQPPWWDMSGVSVIWAGYTSVLGFVIVFRNNQAYTRFWEGATLINQVRGEWFNAVSTLFTFCNHAKEFSEQVDKFQGTLIRLISLLHSSALQQVCDLEDDRLEIIENEGMDEESLTFLQESNDKCEILMQWVQRLIVDSDEQKVLKIAPPLLTRAFQELSRGIVNLNNARKIKEIPFPFPYAQMITTMLIVQWMVNPLIASQVIGSRIAASGTCFFVTLAYWCLFYIALEIDQPFGEDDNDLPLRDMQRDFNRSLLSLMHPLAQKVPVYKSLERPKLTQAQSAHPGDGHHEHLKVSVTHLLHHCEDKDKLKEDPVSSRETRQTSGHKTLFGLFGLENEHAQGGESPPAQPQTQGQGVTTTTTDGGSSPVPAEPPVSTPHVQLTSLARGEVQSEQPRVVSLQRSLTTQGLPPAGGRLAAKKSDRDKDKSFMGGLLASVVGKPGDERLKNGETGNNGSALAV